MARPSGSRLLYAAEDISEKLLCQIAPDKLTMRAVLDPLYDVQAYLQGCAALHGEDTRGMLASSADSIIESVSALIDKPQFWPDLQGQQAAGVPVPAVDLAPSTDTTRRDQEQQARLDLARNANYEIEKLTMH